MNMKNILSTLMAVVLAVTLSVCAFADDTNTLAEINMNETIKNMFAQAILSENQKDSYINTVVSDCAEIALSQINLLGDKFSISSVSKLYNSIGKLVALCFNFEPNGYVIITINDYTPQVVARNHTTPYTLLDENSDVIYIYGGLMNYWTIDKKGIVTEIETGRQCNISDIKTPYMVDVDINMKTKALTSARRILQSKNSYSSNETVVTTINLPETWHNASYYCGPQAMSIVLAYLYNYHYLNLPSEMKSVGGSLNNSYIMSYLINQGYLINDGMSAYNMVHGKLFNSNFKGINDFFTSIGSSISADDKSFSSNVLTEIKNSIINDYPAIVGTTDHDTFENEFDKNHFFIAYGYIQNLTFTRLIVNDGRGHNGYELNAYSRYIDDAVLFS